MALFENVKKALRITASDFDDEITMLIASAKAYLEAAGVKDTDVDGNTADDRVELLITVFCKKMFGYDEKDKEMEFAFRPNSAFRLILEQLALGEDYATP